MYLVKKFLYFAIMLPLFTGFFLLNPHLTHAQTPITLQDSFTLDAPLQATSDKPWEPYDNYVRSFPIQRSLFYGISGTITATSNSDVAAPILIILSQYTSGNCPPTGKTRSADLAAYAGWDPIQTYILKIGKVGQNTLTFNATLPVGVPVDKCMSIFISGGDNTAFGNVYPVTSNVNISLKPYDPTLPITNPVGVGDEFCLGIDDAHRGIWCQNSSPVNNPGQSFGYFYKVTENSKLMALVGNTATGPYYSSTDKRPIQPWLSTSRYYIYPSCNYPAQIPGLLPGLAGPSSSLNQIPANAVKLFDSSLPGTGMTPVSKEVAVTFNDSTAPILHPGGCIVHLVSFNSPDVQYQSTETQVEAYLQTIAAIPGDLNKDGFVNLQDYNLFLANYGRPYTIYDYNNIATNFEKPPTPPPTMAPPTCITVGQACSIGGSPGCCAGLTCGGTRTNPATLCKAPKE